MTGFSRTTVHRKVKNGLLTRPIDIGHRLAWPTSEIKAINKARIAGQTDEEIKKLVIELEAARSQS
jgi:prophage regulatory protein